MNAVEVWFITGNKLKLEIAKKYSTSGMVRIVPRHFECPEIQDMDVRKVVSHSVKYLVKRLRMPLVKSDQGFFIEALSGFPGAYMHYVERCLGAEGFLRLMSGQQNRNCKFVEALAYCEPGIEPVIFTAEIKGRIAAKIRGKNGIGIDFIFIPDGIEDTVATFPESEMKNFYDFRLWPRMIDYLEKATDCPQGLHKEKICRRSA